MQSGDHRLISEDGLVLDGRVPGASNEVYVAHPESAPHLQVIYKPQRGERDLWDFPQGTLSGREVAAFDVSEILGLNRVPLTVWRTDAPLGPGSVQLRVAVDDGAPDAVDVVESHIPGLLPVVTLEDRSGREWLLCHRDTPELRRLAIFDVVINNADRKAGHILATASGYVGIDHGVAFHAESKLRTVLWGWAGEELTADELGWLDAKESSFKAAVNELRPWLDKRELDALVHRYRQLLDDGVFPMPGADWPPLPWPLF